MIEINRITRIISGGIELSIGYQDGKIIISQSENVFKAWIDPDFKKLGLDIPSQPTKKINAVVRELTGKGTLLQIFKDIDPDLDSSVLTMSQIIEFCGKNKVWVGEEGFVAFFLTKRRNNFLLRFWYQIMKLVSKDEFIGKYYVVRVFVCTNEDGLGVNYSSLKDGFCWRTENHHRVVSPQLA